VVYLSNMFFVGYFKLAPFEIVVVKGIIQTLVFGISSLSWSMWRRRMLDKGKTFHPPMINCDYVEPKNRHTISFIILTYYITTTSEGYNSNSMRPVQIPSHLRH